MARSCAVCGKVSMDGFNAQSSGMNMVRAHRRFKPNLQQTTIQVAGKAVKTLICTRCQRTLARADQ
ncbi:MAG TPA: L28 family ribosomal protein [Candidatus Limnocylindrales bacterium]